MPSPAHPQEETRRATYRTDTSSFPPPCGNLNTKPTHTKSRCITLNYQNISLQIQNGIVYEKYYQQRCNKGKVFSLTLKNKQTNRIKLVDK